jgi:hypothetical protein
MKKKKRVPPEVSAYMSRIGKAGYRAKVKKLIARGKVETKTT